MTVFLAAQEEMEVYFNGPMRSGIVLDSQSLLNAGYRDFQVKLAEHLTDLYVGTWECPPQVGRRNQAAFDLDTFQGETVIPRYVICRSFAEEDLLELLEEFHLPVEVKSRRKAAGDGGDEEAKSAPAVFTPDRLEIYVYDFGYASCMIHGRVKALRDLSAEDCKGAAEAISGALPDYAELIQGTLAKIAKAIPPRYIALNTHSPSDEQLTWPGSALRQHIGEMFWVHRIFCFPCRNKAEFERKKEATRNCLYSERAEAMEDKSLRADMSVYPGHGNSSIAWVKGETPDWNAARLRSVIRAMNVFYAALQDCDRDHFHINNETAQRLSSRDIPVIEQQMVHMAQQLSRTGFVKSVFDDYDNQLDPQSIVIWDHLRKAWILGDMFRALDQKISMTEKAYDRLARRLSDLRNRRAGETLVFFLALLCLAGALPALKGWVQVIAVAIVLAFAFGAATLMAVRFFKTK